jgi:CHAT domain-containing protein
MMILTRKKWGYALGAMDMDYLSQDLDKLDALLLSENRQFDDKLLNYIAEIEAEARRLAIPEALVRVLIHRSEIFIADQRYLEAIAVLEEADQELGELRPYDLKVTIDVREAEALDRVTILTRKQWGYAPGSMDVIFLRQDFDKLGALLRFKNRQFDDKLLEYSAEIETEARRLAVPEAIAKVLIQRSEIFIAGQCYPEAMAALGEADQALGQLRPYDLKVAIYAHKAEALGHMEDWPAVISICTEGIRLTEPYRYKASGQYLQSAYLRSRIGLYSWGVKAAYECHDHALMLEWAELSKCRSVLRYQQQQLVPTGTLDRTEKEFQRICQQIDTARAREGGNEPTELLKKRRTLWDLLLIQRNQNRSTATIPEFSIKAIQSALAEDEAVLYYYWLDKQTLLIVLIDYQEIISNLQLFTDKERRKLEKFTHAVQAPSETQTFLKNVSIYSLLLLPQWVKANLRGKRRLLISPHRLLHALPFQALWWSKGDDYLIQQFAITYIPNLTSLTLRYPVAQKTRVLAMGIQDYHVPGHLDDLCSLEDAELEVNELRQLYTESNMDIITRCGAGATESFLNQTIQAGELAGFTCLHFATHGNNLISDTPMESYLFLRDSILDGLEIASWRLNAQLVVLSACCSGQRAIKGRGLEEFPGDDMLGLQAAFFAAGTKQILSTLLPVQSISAREIMVDFHRYLAAGKTSEVALQAAIISYLSTHTDPERQVHFWAPFFLSAMGRPHLVKQELSKN